MTPNIEKLINNQEVILNELFPKTEYEGSFITAENCVEGLYGKVKTDEETEITVCNKNLFDMNKVKEGTLSTSTGKMSTNSSWNYLDYTYIDITQDFNFSWISSSDFFQLNIFYYDKDKNFLGYTKIEKWVNSMTFNIAEDYSNCKYIRITYSIAVSESNVTRENIQLEYGTSKTDYVEHQEQNLTGTNIDFRQYDEITHIYNTNEINMTATVRTKSE